MPERCARRKKEEEKKYRQTASPAQLERKQSAPGQNQREGGRTAAQGCRRSPPANVPIWQRVQHQQVVRAPSASVDSDVVRSCATPRTHRGAAGKRPILFRRQLGSFGWVRSVVASSPAAGRRRTMPCVSAAALFLPKKAFALGRQLCPG